MIDHIQPSYAKSYAAFINRLESETDFLLYERGERKLSEEKADQMIQTIQNQPNSTILVAKKEDRIVGHVMCIGGRAKRNAHSCHVVTGVLKEYHGQGIATVLFQEMDQWACMNQVHRLELTVMIHNHTAIQLYKNSGFVIEGTKRNSLCITGEWIDEYTMAKLI